MLCHCSPPPCDLPPSCDPVSVNKLCLVCKRISENYLDANVQLLNDAIPFKGTQKSLEGADEMSVASRDVSSEAEEGEEKVTCSKKVHVNINNVN